MKVLQICRDVQNIHPKLTTKYASYCFRYKMRNLWCIVYTITTLIIIDVVLDSIRFSRLMKRRRLLRLSSLYWWWNEIYSLQEVGGGCGDWMELAQDRDRWRALVSTVMNLWVPKMRGISWLAVEPVSFSRRTLLRGVSEWVSNESILQGDLTTGCDELRV